MYQLILHKGGDPTTDFLCAIYEGIPDCTVLREEPDSLWALEELILHHDRVCMMGHGSPSGMFGKRGMMVDHRLTKALKTKENIHIWCHAYSFVEREGLHGFSTGMFVSEVGEAHIMNVPLKPNASQDIKESNELFAKLVHDKMLGSCKEMYDHCKELYTYELSGHSDVVRYNRSRLRYYPLPAERKIIPLEL